MSIDARCLFECFSEGSQSNLYGEFTVRVSPAEWRVMKILMKDEFDYPELGYKELQNQAGWILLNWFKSGSNPGSIPFHVIPWVRRDIFGPWMDHVPIAIVDGVRSLFNSYVDNFHFIFLLNPPAIMPGNFSDIVKSMKTTCHLLPEDERDYLTELDSERSSRWLTEMPGFYFAQSVEGLPSEVPIGAPLPFKTKEATPAPPPPAVLRKTPPQEKRDLSPRRSPSKQSAPNNDA